MNVFRRLSSRALIVLVAAIVVVAALAVGVAVAVLGGSSPKPPSRPLDQAIHDALAASAPAGISAEVDYRQHVLNASGLGTLGSSPLVAGGSGHVWIAADGHIRLEFQGPSGATEIAFDGAALTVYHAASKQALRILLPAPAHTAGGRPAAPSLASIDRGLTALRRSFTVSAAVPDSVAGQAAYTVTLSPRQGAGPALALSFDAANGTPLRLELTLPGASVPAFELAVTRMSYSPVSASEVDLQLPAGTKTRTLRLPTLAALRAAAASLSGLGAAGAQQAPSFRAVAPPSLAGLARVSLRMLGAGGLSGVLVRYGRGSAHLTVVELPASSESTASLLGMLPTFELPGTIGHELVTNLGTVVTFDSGGVSFTLAGPVGQAQAEAAARTLAS